MHEDGLKHTVLIKQGLKTGFYLDQRRTRRAFEAALKPGDKVLDVFSYTGAFAMRAARAGALPTAVDMNPLAVDTARADAALNGLEFPVVEANAFEYLPSEAPETYDWILLDPPAIAKTAEKRDSLKWGIWKLAYNALPALKPGGTLIVSACTYQMSLPMLVDTVRLAANDKHVILNLEHMTIQDIDHPAPIQFPEALYLKTAWFQRVD
jgi:23S rRNA (cytosine1962-C5)-methyltransferase